MGKRNLSSSPLLFIMQAACAPIGDEEDEGDEVDWGGDDDDNDERDRTPLHPRRATTGRGTDRSAPAPRPTFKQGHVWVIASREHAEKVFEALLDIRRATLEVVLLENRVITNRRPHDHYATVVFLIVHWQLMSVCVCQFDAIRTRNLLCCRLCLQLVPQANVVL